jgi:AhpD family alkylhydroperoxidase
MKNKLEQVQRIITDLKKELPEQMTAFQNFLAASERPSVLDAKFKELISIALSITAQCEWCIAFHVKKAFILGATRQEILDAASLAILKHGGPALMYMIPLMNALEEFKLVKNDRGTE